MSDEQETRYMGRSMVRREDFRVLTGRTNYTADIDRRGMLHAAFLRSPIAHGTIRSVDVTRALEIEGVEAALDGKSLLGEILPLPEQQKPLSKRWGSQVEYRLHGVRMPVLAVDKVHYEGQPLAVILARDRATAEDGLEKIQADLEPLPAVTDARRALDEEAPVLHPEVGTNEMGRFRVRKGDVEDAFRKAPHRLKRQFRHHRYSGTPMECRGVVAEFDERTDSLTIWSSTQLVHHVRRAISEALQLPEARIRVVAPDVGGGFGVKTIAYPEEVLLAYLARRLRRPIKWIEDRREHLMCTTHSRDQLHEAEVAFDDEGRILAFRDQFLIDVGAFSTTGFVTSYNTAAHMLGPYKTDHYDVECRLVATNKMINAAYRGAGRPEAVFVMERMLDLIAQTLDMEPAEVRRRNMIRPEEMPFDVGIPYRDGSSVIYDGGDYPASLQDALNALGGLSAFRERQREAWARGEYLGLGMACYVEGTGVGPFEGATVRIDSSGALVVTTGSCPHGQGHETTFAQVAADLWGVSPEEVIVAAGDTAVIPEGVGTLASRSTVVVTGALFEASRRLQEKVRALAASILECTPEDLEIVEGKVRVRGAPRRFLTFKELAAAARPGWEHRRPEGITPSLEEIYYYEPPTVTWSYATQAAVVNVDIGTGQVRIENYVVAHDAGKLVNPLLVEGQIHGGVAQGLGGALLEELVYDENGQLLSGSFMDYLLPTIAEMPRVAVLHRETPSPRHPLGVKGLGEGGAIAPPVVIANAVCDALRPFGVEWNHLPVRPDRLLEKIRSRRREMARVGSDPS